MTTVASLHQSQNYRLVVAAARQFNELLPDELLSAAVHAFNSVKKYCKTGKLRRQYKPNMVETLVVVTKDSVLELPAVETLLLMADIDNVSQFLTSMTGIAYVINQLSNDNPF